MSNPTLSVVIPTYNEAQTIGQCLDAVHSALSEVPGEHEVIVVSDGTDATADIVKERFVDRTPTTLITREDASGLSSAVLRGFSAADGDWYGCMDADLQHPPEAMAKMAVVISQQNAPDLVVGSRHVATGRVDGDWPLHRRVISTGAETLARVAVPPARAVSDPMSGLFVIRGLLVDAVRGDLQPHGYKILLELLGRAPIESITEVGYVFRERAEGDSNLGMREYARYVRHLLELSVPSRRGSRGRIATEDIDVE